MLIFNESIVTYVYIFNIFKATKRRLTYKIEIFY